MPFSHFFRIFYLGHLAAYFEARFSYYTYIYIYGNIFCKKITYMCTYMRAHYIYKGKDQALLPGL